MLFKNSIELDRQHLKCNLKRKFAPSPYPYLFLACYCKPQVLYMLSHKNMNVK